MSDRETIGFESTFRSHEWRAPSAGNAARYFLSLARSNANAIAPPGFGSPRTGARVGSGGRRSRGPRDAPVFVSARASPRARPAAGCIVEAHGQRDALPLLVDFHHLHLDDLPGLDDFVRVFNEFIRQLRTRARGRPGAHRYRRRRRRRRRWSRRLRGSCRAAGRKETRCPPEMWPF